MRVQFTRIGDKVIDRQRLYSVVDQVLKLRAAGRSQQEVARCLNTERSFVSRLEALGEVHRGARLAVVGFPLAEKEALLTVTKEEGVEYTLILNDEERWRFVDEKSGSQLLNEVTQIIADLRTYDVVIFFGSDMRVRIAEAMLGRKALCVELGSSPIEGDCKIEPNELRSLIRKVKRTKAAADKYIYGQGE